MKTKFIFFVIFSCLFLLSSCFDDDLTEIDKSIIETPAPEGSRSVNFDVDNKYDLSNATAFSILDSTVVGEEKSSILMPVYSSIIFFLDSNEEVLAIVNVDSTATKVTVNSKTVAVALFDLLPSFHSLSSQEKNEFILYVEDLPMFKNLESTVNSFLEQKKAVYSSDPELVEKLIALNNLIAIRHFTPDEESTKSSSKRVTFQNRKDINSWLDPEENKILNILHSYVEIKLTSTNSDQNYDRILDPNPVIKRNLGTALSEFKDDCYNIEFSQDSDKVYMKNANGLVQNIGEMLLSQVLGLSGKNFRDKCGNTLVNGFLGNGGLVILERIMTENKLTIKEKTIQFLEIVAKTGGAMIEDKSCVASLTSNGTITRFLLKKANAISNVISGIELVTSAIETAHFMMAVIPSEQIKLNETLQIHLGNLIKGCMQLVAKTESVMESYYSGEKIRPEVEVQTFTSFGISPLEDYKINWVVQDDHGTVNPKYFETLNTGMGFTSWILPNLNEETTVYLEAHLIDREGDHLKGSPVKFTTKIKPGLIGKWTLVTFNRGLAPGEYDINYEYECPSVPEEGFTILYEDMIFTKETISRTIKERTIFYNIYANGDCFIYSDDPDTEEESIEAQEWKYTIKDDNLELMANDGFRSNIKFKFLSNGHLELTDAEFTNVYRRD